ncbi:MAG TPA: hypothetical protein VFS21_21095 [Roseiflexaceae bacterium]|nr:hypothetical protein [Roseiflexaceae bacterium]
MITLYDSRTQTALGTITEAQLAELTAQLEEEWADDQDYYINQDTVDVLQEAGVSAELLGLLRQAIATSGEADVRWSRGEG